MEKAQSLWWALLTQYPSGQWSILTSFSSLLKKDCCWTEDDGATVVLWCLVQETETCSLYEPGVKRLILGFIDDRPNNWATAAPLSLLWFCLFCWCCLLLYFQSEQVAVITKKTPKTFCSCLVPNRQRLWVAGEQKVVEYLAAKYSYIFLKSC